MKTKLGCNIDIEKFKTEKSDYMLHMRTHIASMHPTLTRDDLIALHDMIRAELRWPSDCPLDKVAA